MSEFYATRFEARVRSNGVRYCCGHGHLARSAAVKCLRLLARTDARAILAKAGRKFYRGDERVSIWARGTVQEIPYDVGIGSGSMKPYDSPDWEVWP